MFHVFVDDKDENGISVQEKYLVEHLAKHPELLSFKPLSWFLKNELVTHTDAEAVANNGADLFLSGESCK